MAIPAGWYPDPHSPGSQRYWDGTAWTSHSVPAAGQSPSGGPLPLGSDPPSASYDPPPFGAMPSYGAPAGAGPGFGAQGAGTPTTGFGGPPSAVRSDSRQWAMFAHLSALIAAFLGFAFLGPMVVYLTKGNEDPFVRDQAAEALNFNLSVLIYAVVGGIAMVVLIIVLIGLLLIPVFIAGGIAWLVLTILAAVRANRGEAYRYPLTIRFVKP